MLCLLACSLNEEECFTKIGFVKSQAQAKQAFRLPGSDALSDPSSILLEVFLWVFYTRLALAPKAALGPLLGRSALVAAP